MENPNSQRELTTPSPLLESGGHLAQVGWSRQPVLDCNLEAARFYRMRFLQPLRIKRWDYYGITTPTHFYSFTLANLGYAGQVFAYVLDLRKGECREETLTIPPGRSIDLPRNSTTGTAVYEGKAARLSFQFLPAARHLVVDWPSFGGSGLAADVRLGLPAAHESMNIVVPIAGNRFYFNRKVNCMPAEGWIEHQGSRTALQPGEALGTLDWGRGVWKYRSHWVWASASGFLPDGRTVGLNLGHGFGDTTAATENALILAGRIHKLGRVESVFDPLDYKLPWRMADPDGRLDLTFTPFLERVAATNLLLITSEVHQMFGHYQGTVRTDEGELLQLSGLVGWAEEHYARW